MFRQFLKRILGEYTVIMDRPRIDAAIQAMTMALLTTLDN